MKEEKISLQEVIGMPILLRFYIAVQNRNG